MKGYAYLLVTILISMCFSNMCVVTTSFLEQRREKKITEGGGREQKTLEYKCSILPTNETFIIRGACQENGFLTVVENKGLQMSDRSSITPEGAFIKETCSRRGESSFGTPLVRYRHNQSSKYICFSRSGHVRIVNSKLVDRKGKRCMFREKLLVAGRNSSNPGSTPESKTFHTIQSANKKGWILGFQSQRLGVKIPRRGVRHKSLHWEETSSENDVDKCGFLFHSETYVSQTDVDNFSGLLNLIDDELVNNQKDAKEQLIGGSNAAANMNSERRLQITTRIPSMSTPIKPLSGSRERYISESVSDRKTLYPSLQKLQRRRKYKNRRKRYNVKF